MHMMKVSIVNEIVTICTLSMLSTVCYGKHDKCRSVVMYIPEKISVNVVLGHAVESTLSK